MLFYIEIGVGNDHLANVLNVQYGYIQHGIPQGLCGSYDPKAIYIIRFATEDEAKNYISNMPKDAFLNPHVRSFPIGRYHNEPFKGYDLGGKRIK